MTAHSLSLEVGFNNLGRDPLDDYLQALRDHQRAPTAQLARHVEFARARLETELHAFIDRHLGARIEKRLVDERRAAAAEPVLIAFAAPPRLSN